MDDRDLGKVALWKPTSHNPNAPQAKGHVIAHRDIKAGEKLSVSLWRNKSDNPRAPLMNGKIQDYLIGQGQHNAPQTSSEEASIPYESEDDDIPF